MISTIAGASRSSRVTALFALRACAAILLASPVSPVLARPGSDRPAKVGVCEAMDRIEHFRGRIVTIEGHATVDTHGLHLLEPGCGYEFNLEGGDEGTRGARQLAAMIGRMRAGRIMVILRVTGEMVDPEPAPPHSGDVIDILPTQGPYIELDRLRILSRQSLSRQEWRRYQEWLSDPRGDPFE